MNIGASWRMVFIWLLVFLPGDSATAQDASEIKTFPDAEGWGRPAKVGGVAGSSR